MIVSNVTKINWTKTDSVFESDYDYSDAPELSDNFFKNMTVLMPNPTKVTMKANIS